MSQSIRDILDTETKIDVLITCFETYISKCKKYANMPTKGYGSIEESLKKANWAERQNLAERLLNEILEEVN